MNTIDVPAHVLNDPEPEGELEFVEELLADAVKNIPKVRTNLGSSFADAQRLLGFRCALGRPQAEIVDALEAVVDFGVALFQRGEVGSDVMVTLSIRGCTVDVSGGVTEHNSAPRWIAAVSAAMVVRDSAALERLCRFDPEAFEGDYDNYFDEHSRALWALHQREGDVPALLERAVAAAEQATIVPELGQRVAAPCIRVLQAVLAGDEAAYGERLVEGLTSYRTVYQRPDYNHEATNAVPLRYLGVCALAHDRGMACPVRSNYVPSWLVDGAFRQP